MLRRVNVLSLTALTVGVLSGCGGGGSDTPAPTASAEGAYSGSVTNSPTVSTFEAVILEDGELWALYGITSGGLFFVQGLVQGQGTSSNGTFASSNLRDFATVPPLAGTFTATYVAATSLSGTITVGGALVGVSGTAIPAANFDYNAPASVSSVAGSWTLSSTSGDTVTASIAANGILTATGASGCAITGSVTPRPSGKNVFNVQLTFGPAPCGLPGQLASGIGIHTTSTSGAHQLVVAVVDSSRTYGSVAFGTR